MHTMNCEGNTTVFVFTNASEALLNYLACGRLGYNATLFGCTLTIYHKA